MVHVLHIIGGLEVGGAEMVLLRLINSSQGGGYLHTVIALTPGGGMRERFTAAGVEVVGLDFKRSPISQFVRLVSLIRRIRPDIVQTWMYHADLLGGLAARIGGNRNVIWGIRTTDVQSGGTRSVGLVRRVCTWLSAWVPDTIVCAAEASRRAHVEIGYDAAPMAVVPNGFDLSLLVATSDQRTKFRAGCAFAEREIVVGTLGRFNAAKDHQNFVRAAGLLMQQHPNVRVLMVGRNLESSNRELAEWISQTGYADRFVLLGERADVPVCLAAMDIFCLSSRTEGFPNVVGEAMAMGVPCVVTDVGDAAMLVGETGVVVPKEDSPALARGIGQLLTTPSDVRRQLGQKARERIDQEFSMERARDRFERLYQRIISKSKKR